MSSGSERAVLEVRRRSLVSSVIAFVHCPSVTQQARPFWRTRSHHAADDETDDADGCVDAGLLSLNPSDEWIDLSMHSSHSTACDEYRPRTVLLSLSATSRADYIWSHVYLCARLNRANNIWNCLQNDYKLRISWCLLLVLSVLHCQPSSAVFTGTWWTTVAGFSYGSYQIRIRWDYVHV